MNYNAIIKIRANRLNFPLTTLFARQFAAFRALIKDAPGDVSGVFLRIIRNGTEFRDYAAVLLPENPQDWRVTIPAAALADTGTFEYEIHAEFEDSEKTALGRGSCVVQPFSQGGAAPQTNQPVVVAKMPTRNGGWVNCWAVMDSTGEYTYDFEQIEGEEA